MFKGKQSLKSVKYLSIYLVVVWTFYRIVVGALPEEIEELFIKPIIWLTPVLYFMYKEKNKLSSLGFVSKKFIPAIYFALAFGAGFALEGLILNFVKYQGINFSANLGRGTFFVMLGLSFATAFTEETTFRGFIFNRLWKVTKSEWKANLISSFIWGLVHLPIAIFVWKLGLTSILGYYLLVVVFGFGSAFVYARTGNIFSSILLHVFWEWPIMLFR